LYTNCYFVYKLFLYTNCYLVNNFFILYTNFYFVHKFLYFVHKLLFDKNQYTVKKTTRSKPSCQSIRRRLKCWSLWDWIQCVVKKGQQLVRPWTGWRDLLTSGTVQEFQSGWQLHSSACSSTCIDTMFFINSSIKWDYYKERQ